MLDLSHKVDLAPSAQAVAAVGRVAAAHATPFMIVGAFARDLRIWHAYGRSTGRKTEDVDFAVAVADWDAYERLRADLIESGLFLAASRAAHRLRHRATQLAVDLVPFDGVEDATRSIAWPPKGIRVMDMFGFAEALASASTVRLPGPVDADVPSLAALALLKIIAWADRHLREPRRDAQDLMLIASGYLDFGQQERLFAECADLLEATDFDYEQAGATLLGRDIKRLIRPASAHRVVAVLDGQLDPCSPAALVHEMYPQDDARARRLLSAIRLGVSSA